MIELIHYQTQLALPIEYENTTLDSYLCLIFSINLFPFLVFFLKYNSSTKKKIYNGKGKGHKSAFLLKISPFKCKYWPLFLTFKQSFHRNAKSKSEVCVLISTEKYSNVLVSLIYG